MEKCQIKNCESNSYYISLETSSGKTKKTCGIHVEGWFLSTFVILKWDNGFWEVVGRNRRKK